MPDLILLRSDAPKSIQALNHEPAFDVIRELCGMEPNTTLEMIRVLYNNKPAWMLVDEDGLQKRLDPNRDASKVQGFRGERLWIVGPAAIWMGDFS